MNPKSPKMTKAPKNTMVCDTLYLQNELGDPQFQLPFWQTLIID